MELLVRCFAAYQIAPAIERLASDIDDIIMRILEQSNAT